MDCTRESRKSAPDAQWTTPLRTRQEVQLVQDFGDLSVVPTRAFLDGLGPGEDVDVALAPCVSFFLSVDVIGGADDAGC